MDSLTVWESGQHGEAGQNLTANAAQFLREFPGYRSGTVWNWTEELDSQCREKVRTSLRSKVSLPEKNVAPIPVRFTRLDLSAHIVLLAVPKSSTSCLVLLVAHPSQLD